MLKKHFWYYLVVAIISLVFNWIVQMSYYFYAISNNPQVFNNQKVLFEYKTGYIGDVILLPIINVLILFVFISNSFRPAKKIILRIALLSLLLDFSTHYLQAKFALTNWTMPMPFEWNFASHWHMFSFFFQMTYLLLFFYFFWNQRKEIKKPKEKLVIRTVFTLILIFIILLIMDYY